MNHQNNKRLNCQQQYNNIIISPISYLNKTNSSINYHNNSLKQQKYYTCNCKYGINCDFLYNNKCKFIHTEHEKIIINCIKNVLSNTINDNKSYKKSLLN